MASSFSRLKFLTLDPSTPIFRLMPEQLPNVDLDDPAIMVMTDLRRVRVVTTHPNASIEVATQIMIHANVRMLLVVRERDMLDGVVTARDVMGEKVLAVAARERIHHDAIRVHHVMTARAEINPLSMADVERATVGDVVVALRDAGRQHALVIEAQGGGHGYLARGIFSATQIGRQLGIDISPDGHAQSFAELESLLGADTRDIVREHHLAG